MIVSPLLVSIIWCLYNALPPILLFTYAIAGRKYILSFMCGLAMIVSTAAVIASLGFIWWIQVRQLVPYAAVLQRIRDASLWCGFPGQIRELVNL